MTKPYIKQKRYYVPSSVKITHDDIYSPYDLPVSALNTVSCFETCRAYGGRIFHAAQHWQRLEESCAGLGKRLPVSRQDVEDFAAQALAESGFSGALLRLAVLWFDDGSGSALTVSVRAFEAYPASLYESGVSVRSSVMKRADARAQDSQLKASQYVSGVLSVIDMLERSSHELVFMNNIGYVAEGTVSNLFIIKQKRVLTPCVASGILKGVTRDLVIDLAKNRGLEVLETNLTRHEFYSADECFMTNTSSEILAIVEMDSRMIGDGKPGIWTKTLLKDFRDGVTTKK